MVRSTRSYGASTAASSAPPAVPPGAEKWGSRGTARPRARPLLWGFSTKIHLLCDANGVPLHFHLTAGQANESTALEALLEGADANLFDAAGEPIVWPLAMAGDKGYRANWIDEFLQDLDIQPVIPSKSNEDPDARPVKFDRDRYRNIIERLIGWLKEFRRIFSRFEKTAKNFGGMIKMAFIQRLLRLTCA